MPDQRWPDLGHHVRISDAAANPSASRDRQPADFSRPPPDQQMRVAGDEISVGAKTFGSQAEAAEWGSRELNPGRGRAHMPRSRAPRTTRSCDPAGQAASRVLWTRQCSAGTELSATNDALVISSAAAVVATAAPGSPGRQPGPAAARASAAIMFV
jgi:hypothetical protein